VEVLCGFCDDVGPGGVERYPSERLEVDFRPGMFRVEFVFIYVSVYASCGYIFCSA